MRSPAALAGLMLLLCADPAQAGAWPKKAGEGFATVAVRLGWPQDLGDWTSMEPTQDYSTLYLEYGLTDRLTLGLDLGHSVSGAGKTVLFLQYPILNRESGPKVSAQLGFGVISGERVVRPGLAAGWGLPHGWATVEAVAETYPDDGRTDLKLDMTWGRNLARDRKLIVQLQTGLPHGRDPFARLAPSVVLPLRGALRIEAGATWGLTGDSSMGLKLGLWTEF